MTRSSIEVPISTIEIPSRKEMTPDISELANSITEKGLLSPILLAVEQRVHETELLPRDVYCLVDGLRRLRVMQALGKTEISSYVVTTFEDACIELSRVHTTPPPPRRIFEIHQALAPLARQRLSGRIPGSSRPLSRDLLSDALALNNKTSYFAAVLQVYRAAVYHKSQHSTKYQKSQLATELTQQIDAGKLSVYSARNIYMGKHPRVGHIVRPSEQHQLISTAVATLTGVVKALNDLGPLSSKLPNSNLEGWAEDFNDIRLAIVKITRTVRNHIYVTEQGR